MKSAKFSVIFVIFWCVYICSGSKYIAIVDEEIIDCGSAGFIDFTGFELEAINDTLTVLSGRIKYNKEVTDPWTVIISSTRFDRGQWHKGEINRRVTDMCLDMDNKIEPWYPLTTLLKHKKCPIPAGSEEVFSSIPITGFNFEIPSTFAGKWRLKIEMIFNDLLGTKEECREFKFDIMEA